MDVNKARSLKAKAKSLKAKAKARKFGLALWRYQ